MKPVNFLKKGGLQTPCVSGYANGIVAGEGTKAGILRLFSGTNKTSVGITGTTINPARKRIEAVVSFLRISSGSTS